MLDLVTSDLRTYHELEALVSDRVRVVNNYHGLMSADCCTSDVLIYTCLGEAFSADQLHDLCLRCPDTFVVLVTTRRYASVPQRTGRYQILQVPSAYAWYSTQIPAFDHDAGSRQLTKRFLSLNNRAQWNRQALLQMLTQHGIRSKFFFSYWNHDRWNQGSRQLYDHNQRLIGDTWFNRDIDHDRLFAELPIATGIDDFTLDSNDWSLGHPDFYQHSFGSVVNETYIDENHDVFFTEKTMKPLAFRHPFLLFSSAGALEQLRNLGFETFPEYFDESYDLIQSPQQRLEHIFREILRICSLPDSEIALMWRDMLPKLQHNHDVFWHRLPQNYRLEIARTLDMIRSMLVQS
jgi:hypothetical protein